jgi:RNase P subunit RPR2
MTRPHNATKTSPNLSGLTAVEGGSGNRRFSGREEKSEGLEGGRASVAPAAATPGPHINGARKRNSFDIPAAGLSRRDFHLCLAVAHIPEPVFKEMMGRLVNKYGEIHHPIPGSTRSARRAGFLFNFFPEALEYVGRGMNLSVAELAAEVTLREEYEKTYGHKAGNRQELISGPFRRACHWPGCDQEISRGAGLSAKWCTSHRRVAKRRSNRETYRTRKEKNARRRAFPDIVEQLAEGMSADGTLRQEIVTCRSCGAKNRVSLRPDRSGTFFCGICKARMFDNAAMVMNGGPGLA